MNRRLFFLLLFSFVLSASCYSQSLWQYRGIFPALNDTLLGEYGGSGVAVDPNKKVWIIPYKPIKPDSVFVPDSNKYFSSCPVYIFNPDGTPAAFSPIRIIQTKELKNKVLSKTKTGIAADYEGNILVCDYDELVRINYKTGEGMNWRSFISNDNSPLCKPAADLNGFTFVSFCLEGHPIIELNPDFTLQDTVTDNLSGMGRTTDVSNDGNTVFAHRSSAACTYVYSRSSEFDPFELKDTLFKGFKIEASAFRPFHNYLYVSAGSFKDRPLTDPSIPGLFYPHATPGTYYGIDLKTGKIADSLSWKFLMPGSAEERNSGIAFSSWCTGYLTAYGGNYYPISQRIYMLIVDDVEKETGNIVKGYSLSQNYPNPFNPNTDIKFSVPEEAFVTLKVYDILGNEVAQLVNERLSPGNYSYLFNGQNLASGIYIYCLRANGSVISRKMMLQK